MWTRSQVQNYTVHILVYIPLKFCDSDPYLFWWFTRQDDGRTDVHTDGRKEWRTDVQNDWYIWYNKLTVYSTHGVGFMWTYIPPIYIYICFIVNVLIHYPVNQTVTIIISVWLRRNKALDKHHIVNRRWRQRWWWWWL